LKTAFLIGIMVILGKTPYFSEYAYGFVVIKPKEIGLWSGVIPVCLLCIE